MNLHSVNAVGGVCAMCCGREQVTTRVKPRLHMYGHVHETNGHVFAHDVLFVNSAMDLTPRVNVIDVEVPVTDTTPCR